MAYHRVCKGRCGLWKSDEKGKHMVNFISGLSYYAVANRCSVCKVWYPKYVFSRCPCCSVVLRSSRTRFNNIVRRKDRLSPDEVATKIENAIANGWKLLNPDLFKQVKDYEILMQKIKLEKKLKKDS